jgi:serine/threonine-protein kinase
VVLHGRYRVEGLLGKGGFGAVYRAWDLSLSRQCAVKENLDTSPEAQRQFEREARVLASLSHSNLPRVTDHFILPDQGQYLVMDYVEGEDVNSIIEQRGIPSIDQALAWVYQVMDALVYLHSRQPSIVHRDIKPSNIRITPDERAMLVDFGLVKASDPHTKTTLGARAVTPGYSPPEQYGQGNTDTRSDIYSLGATLYALLTGENPSESVLRAGDDTLRPAHLVNPELGPALGAVVGRALALSPSQRYPSVANMKADLKVAAAAPKPEKVVVAPTERAFVAGPASAVDASLGGLQQAEVVLGETSSVLGGLSQPRPAATAQTGQRSCVTMAAAAGLIGVVLLLVVAFFVSNFFKSERLSPQDAQRTIDAGVQATRTAWAIATESGYLPVSTASPMDAGSESAVGLPATPLSAQAAGVSEPGASPPVGIPYSTPSPAMRSP